MNTGHQAGDLPRSGSRTLLRPKVWPSLKACLSVCVFLGATLAVSSTVPTNASATSSTPYAATGYFSVTQKTTGGWTLVTPQGQPFYASGIDTVAPDGSGTDQVTGVCPYCVTVAKDFPSTAAWATSTASQLRSWGFNTIGSFSDDADLRSQMPIEVQLSMASGDDWFAPSFVTNADAVAQTNVAPLANDPNVIGYFTDNELDWGPLLGSGAGGNFGETALQQYLQLPAGSPGLAIAQQYAGNPSGFLFALATRYFQVTTAAVRMYDPNHLILGVKAEGQEIEPALIKAAAPYVNVFSIEDYVLKPGFDQAVHGIWPAYLPVDQNLADLEAVANIPLMIGEYSFMSNDADPNTVPGIYEVASNQQQRANQYENFIAPLYEATPALVGDDWFQYVDEPANGRAGDGENNDFGMIDVNGNPYPAMVAATQLMHNVIADRTGDSGQVCDSWAAGNSGVTCTANMPSLPMSPLTIVTTSLPTGATGTSYFFGGVYAAGGTPDYAYTITQGSLPVGLTLDPTSGIISGTPTTSGTFSFTVQATDSGGSQPVSQALSISVVPGPPATSVLFPSLGATIQGSTLLDASASSLGGIASVTFEISGGPNSLAVQSIGTATATLFGYLGSLNTLSYPNGTYTIQSVATDDQGLSSTSAPLTVIIENLPLTTTVVGPIAGATVTNGSLVDASANGASAITSVTFELSGNGLSDQVVGTATRSYFGWLAYINTTGIPSGTYTLQSVAADATQGSATSAGVAVVVAGIS